MVKKVEGKYILTGNQAAEIFGILSISRIKLTGKVQSCAEKHWKAFEKIFELKLDIKDGIQKA